MSARRVDARLYGNAAILLSAQVITKLFGVILIVVAARRLGVADYGFYVFATSLGNIFGLAVTLGLPQLITREVARAPEDTPRTLGTVLVLDAIVGPIAGLGMVVALLLLGNAPPRLWVAVIAGSTMLLNALLSVITAFFRAHQRMEFEAATRITLSVLNLGLGLAVLFAGFGVLGLSLAQLAAFVIALGLGLLLLMRRLARPSWPTQRQAYRALLLMTLPFALSSVFLFVYDGTAVLFLSYFHGDAATGLYSGAMNFVRVFDILPASLVGAALPAMAQFSRSSPAGWGLLYRRSLKYLLIVGLPIAVGLAILSSPLVLLVLGSEYDGAALVLRAAAALIVVVFVNHGLTNALLSVDRERSFLAIVGGAMVLNIAANLLLIPRWGAYGAIGSSLLTEGMVLTAQALVLARADFRVSIFRLVTKPLLSVAFMALIVLRAAALGLVPAILAGAAAYPVALLALRAFEPDEVALLRSAGARGLHRLSLLFRTRSRRTS